MIWCREDFRTIFPQTFWFYVNNIFLKVEVLLKLMFFYKKVFVRVCEICDFYFSGAMERWAAKKKKRKRGLTLRRPSGRGSEWPGWYGDDAGSGPGFRPVRVNYYLTSGIRSERIFYSVWARPSSEVTSALDWLESEKQTSHQGPR